MSPVTGATVGATVGPGDESDDRAPTVGAGTGSGEGLGDGAGDRGAGTGADPDASGARPRRALPWSNATYVAEKKTSPRIHVPTLSSAATERRHASSAGSSIQSYWGHLSQSKRGQFRKMPADPSSQ